MMIEDASVILKDDFAKSILNDTIDYGKMIEEFNNHNHTIPVDIKRNLITMSNLQIKNNSNISLTFLNQIKELHEKTNKKSSSEI